MVMCGIQESRRRPWGPENYLFHPAPIFAFNGGRNRARPLSPILHVSAPSAPTRLLSGLPVRKRSLIGRARNLGFEPSCSRRRLIRTHRFQRALCICGGRNRARPLSPILRVSAPSAPTRLLSGLPVRKRSLIGRARNLGFEPSCSRRRLIRTHRFQRALCICGGPFGYDGGNRFYRLLFTFYDMNQISIITLDSRTPAFYRYNLHNGV